MKISLLRQASQLIEDLDKINDDLAACTEAKQSTVVIKLGNRQLTYKPQLAHYRDFLEHRKKTVESLLARLGIDTAP